jgi:polyisoprenoid-binding protein YceI
MTELTRQTTTTTTIPGYLAGTWTIDPVHSEVGFSVRHMMVSKVRGKFSDVEGSIVTAETPLESSATATITLNSIDTGNSQRDDHLRSADFFEVEKYPAMTYRTTGIRPDGEDFVVEGELTLKGVTKQVPLRLELGGFGPDPYGGTRAGFSATGELNRQDFGVSFSGVIEAGGGAVVADKITLHLEIEAVLN